VTDLMSEGRLEVGVGPGGNLTAFTAFGLESDQRHALFDANLATLKTAWSGGTLAGGDKLYPASPTLVDRIWQATFTVPGARRAGLAGDGLMLSRTQPRSPEAPQASLADIQNPMLDAYLEALPKGVEPRILASRTIFVADDHDEAMRLAEIGLSRLRHRLAATGNFTSGSLVGDLIRAMDVHIGTPDEVIASLQADSTLQRSTDLTMQVHSIDPPHPYILRSIELFAEKVAPALGWAPEVKAGTRQVA
jgi:putative FMN-dependent luciferase-like monooxygenase